MNPNHRELTGPLITRIQDLYTVIYHIDKMPIYADLVRDEPKKWTVTIGKKINYAHTDALFLRNVYIVSKPRSSILEGLNDIRLHLLSILVLNLELFTLRETIERNESVPEDWSFV